MKRLSRTDIEEIIKEIMVSHNNYFRDGIEYEDVLPDCTFVDLGFDSLDVLDVCIDIESKLNIDIEDVEVEDILMRKPFNEVVDFIVCRYRDTAENQKKE